MDCLAKMIDLALANRTARITYRKSVEDQPSDRIVEPYRTSHNGQTMIIQCWQAAPVVLDGAQWRWFRADRILNVIDGGSDFIPRCKIALSKEAIGDFQDQREKERAAEAVDKYFRYVEAAMTDGHFDEEEMAVAKELTMGVSPQKLKVIHAHIYINVLNELLVDGELTDREEKYLGQIKRSLTELGWCP